MKLKSYLRIRCVIALIRGNIALIQVDWLNSNHFQATRINDLDVNKCFL